MPLFTYLVVGNLGIKGCKLHARTIGKMMQSLKTAEFIHRFSFNALFYILYLPQPRFMASDCDLVLMAAVADQVTYDA